MLLNAIPKYFLISLTCMLLPSCNEDTCRSYSDFTCKEIQEARVACMPKAPHVMKSINRLINKESL